MLARALACAAAVAALVLAAAANGQAPSAAAASPTPPPALSAAAQAAVDDRIAQLQARLGITSAQLPLWSAFAAAMRDNAAATDALFARRAGALATMSAVENMHSYAEIARAYADNTERLATAFDTLYASLSDTQKQAADAVFHEQAAAAARPHSRR
jgi:hypothetical protein